MRKLKLIYVRLMRILRTLLAKVGVLAFLEKRRDKRFFLWLRSLFAIYDIDDMTALDIPWWSLEATEKVGAYLAARPDARVFEYGSGASTVWLAKRSAEVITIEHDEPWAEIVNNHLSAFEHAQLRVVPPAPAAADGDSTYRSEKPGWADLSFEQYVKAIDGEADPFDLIVVDGRARSACLKIAQQHLKPGGMIVFDNSGRQRYRDAIESSPLRIEECRGLTACLPYVDPTTLMTSNAAPQ